MQPPISALPALADNLSQVKLDLAEFGVGLLSNALTLEEVTALKRRLEEQAIAERQMDVAFLEDGNMDLSKGGPNQRVFGLIGKGEVFRNLAVNNQALDVARSVFGASYGLPDEFVNQAELDDVLLSSMTANIVGPGSTAMAKHADQAYMPPTTPYAGVLNVIWLLSDFASDNGATLVSPGSHLSDDPFSNFSTPPPCAPLIAPAGTAVFLDGRTWHGTGENTTERDRSAVFSYYCRPFMRQQENYMLTLSPDLVKNMSDELVRLLGYRVWFTLGGIEGSPNGSIVNQSTQLVDELHSK